MGENSTFVPEPPYLKKYWLVCESLLVILTFVAIYLTMRLMQYAFDKKSNSKIGREIVQKKWLKGLCATSSFAFVLRLISNHLVAFLGWQSDELCYATVTASTVLFCITIYPIYIFLWVRQSIFYTNPVIRKGLNVWVTRISWFTLVFMIATGLTMPFLYNVPAITGWEYRTTEQGCMEVSEDSAELAPGIAVTFTILFQVVLLGLFIYPLLSKEMAKYRAPKSASPSKSVYNIKTNSLSKSDETKNQDSELDESHDDAFYPTSRPVSPLVRPISPLALSGRQNFSFERTPKVSESENESAGMLDSNGRNGHIVKRKVSAGGYQYSRAQANSVSSGQVTPAISDTEQPKMKANAFWGTIRRLRKDHRQSKRKESERRKQKEGRKLLMMMKNYSRLMAICVCTDAVTAGIQIAWVLPELIYLLMFDFNILINLICIVLTYAEWQVIILPCTVHHDDDDSAITTSKLRRRPTPIKRGQRPSDRVKELKREGKTAISSGRTPSGSGYDSADSSTQMYRPAVEMHPLQKRTEL